MIISLTPEERRKLIARGLIFTPTRIEPEPKVVPAARPYAHIVRRKPKASTQSLLEDSRGDHHHTGFLKGQRVVMKKPWMEAIDGTVVGYSYKHRDCVRVKLDGLTNIQTIPKAFLQPLKQVNPSL